MKKEGLFKQKEEFLESWEKAESYFNRGCPKALPIVKILKEKGFETKTFAYQSLYDLILTNKGSSGLELLYSDYQ